MTWPGIVSYLVAGWFVSWAISAVRGARRRARREAAELITERARAYYGPTRLALLDVARELLEMPLIDSGRSLVKASPPSPRAGAPEASREDRAR